MGLIKAAFGAAGGVMADQWKEFFYCEAIPADVLAVKGKKKVTGRSSNTKGDENIITNGSVIAVADGQCMLIVEQGKIVDMCAEPGEYTYDMSTEPSLFTGDLGESIKGVFQNIGKRFTFGGEAPKDQRVYYFNTKELTGNKYGTPSPVPFRVVDQRAGIDIDIAIRCFGEYSIRLKNPMLFYTNVCGNVTEDFKTEQIAGQMKTELLTALQPAFAKISEMGIRYSALPGHTLELAEALNEQLSSRWRDLRGMEIVSFGVSSVKANEEDEQMIKELQRNAAFMDPTRAAAHLVGAQASAMQSAASNQGAGPAMAFMGMGMAGQMGGMNAQNLYQMGAQQQGAAAGATHFSPLPRTCRSRRLDLLLRTERHHRQLLPQLRQQKARAQAGSRELAVRLRCDCHRKVLPGVRQAQACRGRLDLFLRYSEQGKILCRVRGEKACWCPPVQVRQMWLGT